MKLSLEKGAKVMLIKNDTETPSVSITVKSASSLP